MKKKETKQTDAETIEKHYRLTMDFRLLVRPITSEVCKESFHYDEKTDTEDNPDYRERVEMARRLHRLLLSNRAILEEYLLSVIISDAGSVAEKGLWDAFDTKEESEILIPLFKSMNEEDRQFFEECLEMGVLSENTELVSAAFKVDWLGVEIGEMDRRLIGDPKRAQIVEETKSRLFKQINS